MGNESKKQKFFAGIVTDIRFKTDKPPEDVAAMRTFCSGLAEPVMEMSPYPFDDECLRTGAYDSIDKTIDMTLFSVTRWPRGKAIEADAIAETKKKVEEYLRVKIKDGKNLGIVDVTVDVHQMTPVEMSLYMKIKREESGSSGEGGIMKQIEAVEARLNGKGADGTGGDN